MFSSQLLSLVRLVHTSPASASRRNRKFQIRVTRESNFNTGAGEISINQT